MYVLSGVGPRKTVPDGPKSLGYFNSGQIKHHHGHLDIQDESEF